MPYSRSRAPVPWLTIGPISSWVMWRNCSIRGSLACENGPWPISWRSPAATTSIRSFSSEAEAAGCHIRKEHGAQRVLEPRVVGPGVHEVGKTELPDVAEALQRRGIEQGKRKVLHFNITMDRVLDDLQIH